jgi:uncharacterized membrane-anchored protein
MSSDDDSPSTGRDVFDRNDEKNDNYKECETLAQIARKESAVRKRSKKVQVQRAAKNNKQKSAKTNSLSASSAAACARSVSYGANELLLVAKA